MLSTLEEKNEVMQHEEQEKTLETYKEILEAIKQHDYSKFDTLCSRFKHWAMKYPKLKTTYVENAVRKAVIFSNEEAFNLLLNFDSQLKCLITKEGRWAPKIFFDTITYGTPQMVDQLMKSNREFSSMKSYLNNENPIATAIRTVTAQNILRCGKFKNEQVRERFINWFIGIEENLELSPGEEVIEFYGAIDMVNMLLSHKADFWSMDEEGITPYEILVNPENPKYQKWFYLELSDFKNLTFFQHNGEAQLSLRGTGEISDRNYEKNVKITIEYHFSELRAILEKARMSAAFENALSNQKIQQLEQQVQGLNIKNFMQDHYIKQTAVQLENRVQKVEMEVTPVVQKNQETLQWEARKRMVDSQALTQLFCERVDYRLRSCINASIVLASGNVQREKGSVEGVLTETLNMIADCMGVFVNVTLKLIAKGIEVGMDWRNEKLFKATAKLFAFSDPNMVSDRTAIAITEICTPLLQPLTKEADVKKYADRTVAFLMYLMSHEQLVKQSDNPIENQLIDNFAKSELLMKYRLEFDKKEQEVLAQEQQSFDKQQKKKEGSGGFKILSFKSPWKKSSKGLNNGNNDNASEQMVLSYNQKPSLAANIT